MDKTKSKVADENFKVYTRMIQYVRNLNMLEVHKREITQKLYNMYLNLTKKETNLERYVVNPKEFCDKICEGYIKSTPIAMVYLETVKKFSLVIAIMALACDLIFKKSFVNKSFVYVILGSFVVSIILTYLKMYRSVKYGINEEPLKYKIIYNAIALIMIVPIFLIKDTIKVDANISMINIGLVCIVIFFISTFITNINKNNINKKINCKSIV